MARLDRRPARPEAQYSSFPLDSGGPSTRRPPNSPNLAGIRQKLRLDGGF